MAWQLALPNRRKQDKAPGPSKFQADTIQCWAQAEDGLEDVACFLRLSDLCKKIFLSGTILKQMKEGILVLLPKSGSKGKFRGITLLVCVNKLILLCLNERVKKAISFHEGIHGFWSQRGCQMVLFEAKMNMQAW